MTANIIIVFQKQYFFSKYNKRKCAFQKKFNMMNVLYKENKKDMSKYKYHKDVL